MKRLKTVLCGLCRANSATTGRPAPSMMCATACLPRTRLHVDTQMGGRCGRRSEAKRVGHGVVKIPMLAKVSYDFSRYQPVLTPPLRRFPR